ncbi:MAG TPA: DMT family transporter [Burkholderiales bacterium]|nr:DMT family transporter [Burkholderiales bacterium]
MNSGEYDQHTLRGIFCHSIALLLFACLDAVAKYLSAQYPVPLIVWVRYIAQFALMTLILAPMFKRDLLRTNRTTLVLVRSACLVMLSWFAISAFSRLPLAETTSIQFIAPLLVALLAKPLLKERIGLLRWVALLTGFAGVLLIVRPGGQLDAGGVVFALLSAIFYASYQLLSRVLGGTERPVAMLYYSALLGTVCFSLLLPWFWEGPPPSAMYYVLFVSMGVLGGLGHFFFTEAFRCAPASLLAPLTYLQLVWAGLLGWLVFGQLPDRITLIGMAVISVSGIAVTIHGRRTRRAPSKVLP